LGGCSSTLPLFDEITVSLMASQTGEQPRIPPLQSVVADRDAQSLLTTGVNEFNGGIKTAIRPN
jgi:hypothetical protein